MREKTKSCGAGCQPAAGLSTPPLDATCMRDSLPHKNRCTGVIVLVLTLGCLHAQQAGKPETVMVTYHAKTGSETALARVIARHWSTMQDLKLAGPGQHLTLRGTEDGGKTYFVDIFTWRDASIPDSAPPAIQTIWKEMGELVEARGGRQAIEIAEVSVVTPERPPLVAKAARARPAPQNDSSK